MKKRVLYLIMCVFAFTAASAQIETMAIVGDGVGGWPGNGDSPDPNNDTHQMTKVDADNWIIIDLVVKGNGIKFRANNTWDAANKFIVGAPTKPAIQFPSAIGVSPGDNIEGVVPGTYTVKLNTATLAYSFESGVVIPVVKLVGTAVDGGSVNIPATSATTFEAKLNLLAGDAQFDVDGVLLSDSVFPGFPLPGNAFEGGPAIPVTAGKWIVKLNVETGDYSFEVAPNEAWAITGSALKTFGYDWGTDLLLDTTDGVTYTSSAPISMEAGGFKFRVAGDWGTAKGCDAPDDNSFGFFPTGLPGGKNINVSAEQAGSYSVTFNANTGEYSFTSLSTKGFSTANFKVSPNPTTNNWNFTTVNDSIESIQILDVLGKNVMTVSPRSNTANVDASSLTRGIYFAKVATAKATQTLKLMKN
ncbi:T9SS type A sorting domain-containing protein [Flavobacterium luteum]|uniref:T9SS type A sorting domain-containing protein n=1 Tax=Flavobacterium luteum TaxID=2026654 RepID=A0A7J5ABN7_9FLAO|nr:T9SS type A sorting domain-containing protein [Flavobacterium luteum]KAB1154991.1 T9SS type A sorting domain-containing protein [Flavobacterium luteum]